MEGWIKLHRALFDWEWWGDHNTVILWITILLHVNHEKRDWRGIEILPGQMVTSYSSLAEKSTLSIQNVRTSLRKLESTGEITCKSTHKNTLITVVKWADFQGDVHPTNTVANTESTHELTQYQHSTNTVLTTNKNDKNEKNEKKVRNIFIAPSLEEVADYIQEKGYSISPEQFLNYYTSNGWMVGKTKMKDWKSAIRYWQSKQKPQTTTKGELPF